jgi:uncharacterized protein YqiB (DUF1249 family)
MFIDITEQRVKLVRPRSFAGLMTLYESNHVRLRQLLGDFESLARACASTARGDLDLHLTVLERCRYTTSLNLTYWLAGADGSIADPDLAIRIYHDARLAEATSCVPHHRHHALSRYHPVGRTELEHRWAINILLNKWLEFCLDHGHGFGGNR